MTITVKELIEVLSQCSPELHIYAKNNSTPIPFDRATIELHRVGMRGKSIYWVNDDPEWSAETFDATHMGLIVDVSKMDET